MSTFPTRDRRWPLERCRDGGAALEPAVTPSREGSFENVTRVQQIGKAGRWRPIFSRHLTVVVGNPWVVGPHRPFYLVKDAEQHIAAEAAPKASATRREEFLPFHKPYLGEEEIAEVVDTLKSGWLTLGPKTRRFEERFAEALGAEHAVAVSSCTAALHLSLEALGIGPGDEVITSPYTFTATAASILYCGATPILVDTAPDYPLIDVDAVEAAVTDRTKAILPVHYGGAACDLSALYKLGDRVGAHIVEDAAHALPTRFGDRWIGADSKAVCFSLYAGKNITTGEGGVVTTNDAALAEQIRVRRLHGISRDAWKRYTAEGSWYYEVEERGFKYNMTDMNAAIGIHQLDRLSEFHARRVEFVNLYRQCLDGVPGVTVAVPPGQLSDSAWHLLVIQVDEGVLSATRNEIIELLKADNIGTSVHFIPIHHHPFFQERLGCRKDGFTNASRFFERAISLPLFPTMTRDDVKSVAASLRRIAEAHLR